MKQPKFINTANSQIVTRRMKGQSNKRFIWLELFFDFEIEHSQQFATKIFVIPNPNSTVKTTAGCNKGSLLANIHPCDGTVVETFVDIFENNLFIGYVVDKVGYLRNQIVYVESCDIVVGQRYGYYVLFHPDWYAGHSRCSFLGCGPFPRQL